VTQKNKKNSKKEKKKKKNTKKIYKKNKIKSTTNKKKNFKEIKYAILIHMEKKMVEQALHKVTVLCCCHRVLNQKHRRNTAVWILEAVVD